jgi:hypothetical protein
MGLKKIDAEKFPRFRFQVQLHGTPVHVSAHCAKRLLHKQNKNVSSEEKYKIAVERER